jgi:hypothetical protein
MVIEIGCDRAWQKAVAPELNHPTLPVASELLKKWLMPQINIRKM